MLALDVGIWHGRGLMSQPLVRVYEYVDDQGVVYWSLTKHETTISPPRRMILQDRKGTVLGEFLAQLRSQGMALLRSYTNPKDETESDHGH